MIIKLAVLMAGFGLLAVANLPALLTLKKKEKTRALVTFALLLVTGLALSLFQVLGIEIISPAIIIERLVKVVWGIFYA